jgi:hypothetical protein
MALVSLTLCISFRLPIKKTLLNNRALHATLTSTEIINIISSKLPINETLKVQKALLEMEKDHELMLKDHKHNYDIELVKKNAEIASLVAEGLRRSSACTSRGILEFALKACYIELGLKGSFNACRACEQLVRCMLIFSLFMTYFISHLVSLTFLSLLPQLLFIR